MKNIFVIIAIVFLTNVSIYAQYCNDTSCVWIDNSITTNLQQFPGCSVQIIYEQGIGCKPERCLVRIKKFITYSLQCKQEENITIINLDAVKNTTCIIFSSLVNTTESTILYRKNLMKII